MKRVLFVLILLACVNPLLTIAKESKSSDLLNEKTIKKYIKKSNKAIDNVDKYLSTDERKEWNKLKKKLHSSKNIEERNKIYNAKIKLLEIAKKRLSAKILDTSNNSKIKDYRQEQAKIQRAIKLIKDIQKAESKL